MKKKIIMAVVSLLVSMHATTLKASIIYPLTVFTDNGDYFDDSVLNLSVEVIPMGSTIDFKFHNESLIESSIARIYFDDNSMLSLESISEGLGTSFSVLKAPPNLPAGRELETPFETDFGVQADAPSPQNGINPTESLTIHCDLTNNATFADITNALNEGSLRIGVHIIALPDGSSEAAVIPEPAAILFLGFGAVMLRKKRLQSIAK